MWMSFGAPNDGDDDDDDDDLLRPSECPPTVRECGCCVRDAFTSLTWMLQRIFGHPKHQHTRTGHRTHDKHTYTTHWGGPGHADAGQKKKQPGTETCCVVGSKTKKCPWHLIHAALMRTETEWSCSLAPNRHSGTKSSELRDITIYFFKEILNLNFFHPFFIYFVLHSLEITQKTLEKPFLLNHFFYFIF